MKGHKRKYLKQLLIICFILILAYFFREDLAEAWVLIKATAPRLIIICCLIMIGIQWIDALIIRKFVNMGYLGMTPYQAFKVAVKTQFAKVLSLGSGTAIGLIYYLKDYNIPYTYATSVSLLTFVIQKFTMGLIAVGIFLVRFTYFETHFANYIPHLLISFVLILGICIGMIVIGSSTFMHTIVLKLLHLIDYKKKHENFTEMVGERLKELREACFLCLHHPTAIIKIMGGYALKHAAFYAIPYVLLRDSLGISYYEMFTIMAIVAAVASIIPSPSGMGSTEFIFVALMGMVGYDERSIVLSAILLYRFMIFIFPGILGGIYAFVDNMFAKE